MSDSLEDSAAGCLGQIFAYGLIIMAIGWVLQWVWQKIVTNKGPILTVLGIILALVIIGVIINKQKEAQEAVTKWEQNELVPLLTSLNAMDKLNNLETFVASLPDKLETVENRVPALEQRADEADSQAKSLNGNPV